MVKTATISDVRDAQDVIRPHLTPSPLIRSYELERELGLQLSGRRVWLKDFGWTPVGSFKLLGALNWMAGQADEIGDRPVVAQSSGNFASGIAFAGMKYDKRVIVVMPDSAPEVKVRRTLSFGAEIRTYDISQDHVTGARERMVREIVEQENGVHASPYNHPLVIAGNGVGGLEVVDDLRRTDRNVSHFFCPVSGGGLMAGMALAMADGFPQAKIIGVEPEGADDFRQSLAQGERVRLDHPKSICDGLLSYDVGEYNWPILKEFVAESVTVPDTETCRTMRWLYDQHGLRSEPSGAIALAAALARRESLDGDGDIVITLSGRNVDEPAFRQWIEEVS